MTDIVVDLARADSSADDGWACKFEFCAPGQSVPARVIIGRDFPSTLPTIYVDPACLNAEIPHLSTSGELCYRDPEGLSSSLRDPSSVLVQALHDAHTVLCEGLAGTNNADIIEELDAYWLLYTDSKRRAALTPGNQVKRLDVWYRDGEVVLLSDNKHSRSHLGSLTANAVNRAEGLYVPVPSARFDRQFIDAVATGDVSASALFSTLESDNRQLLSARSKELPARVHLVLGVGDDGSERAVVGAEFTLRGEPPAPRLFSVTRVDRQALLPRAGQSAESWLERVVLVGCGALGGHVATAVARMGIRELTLIDPDSLAAENVYRHVLGFSDVDAPKAEALAHRISADIPHLRTVAIVEDVSDVDDGLLRTADLVIVTIANPSAHRRLNQRLHDARCRVVYGWLEPLGIGGHALLTGEKSPGCVECLHVRPDGTERLHAWTDFAAPNQTFARRHAGCRGSFTPFADLDARRTADLLLGLIARVHICRHAPASLLAWRGSPERFLAAGYELSEFAKLTQSERELISGSFAQSRCPVCGR